MVLSEKVEIILVGKTTGSLPTTIFSLFLRNLKPVLLAFLLRKYLEYSCSIIRGQFLAFLLRKYLEYSCPIIRGQFLDKKREYLQAGTLGNTVQFLDKNIKNVTKNCLTLQNNSGQCCKVSILGNTKL